MDWNLGSSHNVEVTAPGEFSNAIRPLEASIKITPTVVLTNTLPYPMEVSEAGPVSLEAGASHTSTRLLSCIAW